MVSKQTSNFTIHVNGKNNQPSAFLGNESSEIIDLGPGLYAITEEGGPAKKISNEVSVLNHYSVNFSSDCAGYIKYNDKVLHNYQYSLF